MVSADEIKAARATLKQARAERRVPRPEYRSEIISEPYSTADGRERVTLLIPLTFLRHLKGHAATQNGVSTYAVVRDNLPWVCEQIEGKIKEYGPGKWVKYGLPAIAAEQVAGRFKTEAEAEETQAAPEPASG